MTDPVDKVPPAAIIGGFEGQLTAAGEALVKRQQIEDAYSEAFMSPAGRIVMGHLEHHFGYLRKGLFEGIQTGDSMSLARRAGHQEVLAHIARWTGQRGSKE